MKMLIRVAVVAAGLAALPARASEFGLLVDKQVGSSQGFGIPAPALGAVPFDSQIGASFDASKPGGYGIRGAYTVLDLKVAEVGLTATYHPESRTDLVMNGVHDGKFNDQYIAVGAQVDWKFLVNLHAGIDIRRERLTTDGNSIIPNGSTTYTRPWIQAGIGYTLPSPVVSPFVRLEVAMATTKQGNLSASSSSDDFRKAMAPDYQIGLYGGIRF
jgi:hypothetical protein